MNPWDVIGWLILLAIIIGGGGYLLLIALAAMLPDRTVERPPREPMRGLDKFFLWFAIIMGLMWLFTR